MSLQRLGFVLGQSLLDNDIVVVLGLGQHYVVGFDAHGEHDLIRHHLMSQSETAEKVPFRPLQKWNFEELEYCIKRG